MATDDSSVHARFRLEWRFCAAAREGERLHPAPDRHSYTRIA
ncbi:hypothetical protein GCM10018790_63960 [Kitasatospora xanthocidica]|nr:hypothetical protein [Kitasatospora xanthocidica]GHF77065.1 hypothetical protein GCM10018790_63960 [Kitasatospora xanthocidica]